MVIDRMVLFLSAMSRISLSKYDGWRRICTSTLLLKNIRSATPKVTPNQSKPLTYEEANFPYNIGVRKSWNSWNTGN